MRLLIFSFCFFALALASFDTITDDVDFECFKKAANKMNTKSCPEVNGLIENNNNSDKEETMRLQVSCYKRYYLNNKCNVVEWNRICHKMIGFLSEERNGKDLLDFARKYCTA